MPRKQRIDSAAEAVRIMAGAGKVIEPPAHIPLEPRDMPYWDHVIAEFARADWTQHQIEMAAILARTMANLESNQRRMRKEGFVITNHLGKRVTNPRNIIVKGLTSDVLSMRRSLALHARAKSDARDTARNKALSKAIEAGFHRDDDDLLARPLN